MTPRFKLDYLLCFERMVRQKLAKKSGDKISPLFAGSKTPAGCWPECQ